LFWKTAICFGARKRDAGFEAHACVECQGTVLNEAKDVHQRFAPFEVATVAARTE